MAERDMQELHDTTEKCCAILRATNDGDDLAPHHLKLLEMCVNGFANEKGHAELDRIYKEVAEQGGYKKPFFHGVEDMTIDNEGYVYYKGNCVEHYTLSWAYSDGAKQQLIALHSRCKELESRGIEVNSVTAVWNYPESLNQKKPAPTHASQRKSRPR